MVHFDTEQTECFELIDYGSNEAFIEHKLIKTEPNEIIFELMNPAQSTSRKFKIDDKKYMLFYSKITAIVNKGNKCIIPNENNHNKVTVNVEPDTDRKQSQISQTLICGYLRFDLHKIVHIIPAIIIELAHKYANPLRLVSMAVLFKNNGLQFVALSEETASVRIQICTVSCHNHYYFKKWDISSAEIKELETKYHQITYISNIKYAKIPRLFSKHELFERFFGNNNNNLSAILTSYFSFIIFDGLLLKTVMDSFKNVKLKGIEFQLPNIGNNYDELKYFKMDFSAKHGVIAYKDNDIYRLDLNKCANFYDFNVLVSWERVIHFPIEISITAMCWLTENKLFLCGQSAVILDIHKGKYHELSKDKLDEFILFPSGLKYNFVNNCVFVVGGSHGNKAQFYDIAQSKWAPLKNTNYSHNGQSGAPKIWFDYYHPYLLYCCSYYEHKIMMERLDTRDVGNNKWVSCDSDTSNVHNKLAQCLDFNVWNFSVCS